MADRGLDAWNEIWFLAVTSESLGRHRDRSVPVAALGGAKPINVGFLKRSFPIPLVLLALFAGCGDMGQSANVASVAGEPISSSAFNHWFKSFEAQAGDREPEARSTARTMTFLINASWVNQEARRRGITVTDYELDEALEQQKREFGGEEGLRALREQISLSASDFRTRLRLDLLGRKLQRAMVDQKAVTAGEVSAHYLRNQQKFIRPARRQLRAATTQRKAEATRAGLALRRGGELETGSPAFRGSRDPG